MWRKRDFQRMGRQAVRGEVEPLPRWVRWLGAGLVLLVLVWVVLKPF